MDNSYPNLADNTCTGRRQDSQSWAHQVSETGPLSSEDQSLGLSVLSACLLRVFTWSTKHVV